MPSRDCPTQPEDIGIDQKTELGIWTIIWNPLPASLKFWIIVCKYFMWLGHELVYESGKNNQNKLWFIGFSCQTESNHLWKLQRRLNTKFKQVDYELMMYHVWTHVGFQPVSISCTNGFFFFQWWSSIRFADLIFIGVHARKAQLNPGLHVCESN